MSWLNMETLLELLPAILLMLLGIGFIILEMFVPSGGVLGFLSIVAVLASIIVAFYYHGVAAAVLFLAFAVLVVPVVVVAALHWWPHTPLGRMVVIHPASEEEVLPDTEQTRLLSSLLGKRGRSNSPMLPSGAVTIEGRRYHAVSEGMPIEAGQPIQVVRVEGNHVVVRPAEGDTPPAEQDEDILSRPIESLGLDPFDDPLA